MRCSRYGRWSSRLERVFDEMGFGSKVVSAPPHGPRLADVPAPSLELPPAAGTYVLHILLTESQEITVGRLGRFYFPAGLYLYCGSARGSGGIRARVGRHLRWSKALHWHVDYLLQQGAPTRVWYVVSAERLECAWARAMLHLPGALAPVAGFGSSDCACSTHLAYLPHGHPPAMVRDGLPAGCNPRQLKVSRPV